MYTVITMSSGDIQIIKEKLPIYDVVSSYVKLEKAGNNWKAKSPFTNEKTPSFFVVPDKDFFYCFSSGKGGDIFTFIQEIEGVDFQGALKLLAERAGVNLDETSPQKSDERKDLYLSLEYATRLYAHVLRTDRGKDAYEYLVSRGLSEETIKEFRIGFAPKSWDFIHHQLSKQKISESILTSAGLVKRGDQGKYYDRFRARIMFPIADSQGRIVGFSGRLLPGDDTPQGKYINSPEGPLFDKSRILYGYDKAKQHIARADRCVIVEGQMDVIMAHQAGSKHTVGISGTGLTLPHLDLISRFTNTILFALDADGAGVRALARSVERAYSRGFVIGIVVLPEGEDPASFIQSDSEKWKQALDHPIDYIDFLLDPDRNARGDRTAYVKSDVFPVISWMSGHIERDRAIQKTAGFLGVSEDALRADFEQFLTDMPAQTSEGRESVPLAPHTPKIQLEEELAGLLAWISEQHATEGDIVEFCDRIRANFNNISSTTIEDIQGAMPTTKRDILSFLIHQKYEKSPIRKIKDSCEELLLRFEVNVLQKQNEEILNEIRSEEQKGSGDLKEGLLARYKDISDKIIILKNKLHTYGS